MDPAQPPSQSGMETGPELTAVQRLERAEGEVSRLSGEMAFLLQLGHQQQQQFQQIFLQQQQLNQALQLLTGSATQSVSAAPPAPAPSVRVILRLWRQVRAFLTSCRVQFSLQPRTFSTEAAKVGYVITHLTGRARLWGAAEYDRQTLACTCFEALAEEMLKVFDLGSPTTEASQALLTIRQGTRTVADYSIDFWTLANRSSWNMGALVDAFLHSLADYLKDELVSHEPPSTLDEAIALAVRIDRRIQTRRRERGQRKQPAVRTWGESSAGQSPPVKFQSSPNLPEPMEIGRASLTPEERRRRLASNLCLYCGGEGHRVATCPLKAAAHQG